MPKYRLPTKPSHQCFLMAADQTAAHISALPLTQHAQWLANAVVDKEGKVLTYSQLLADPVLKDIWERGMCKELGRLAQGFEDTEGTNTIKFITKDQVPKGRDITYFSIVCAYKPHKEDKARVRLCVGGGRLSYDGETCTKTADLTTVKLHIKSTISTPGARYVVGDIKNFYLGTPLKRFEHAQFHKRHTPQAII